MATEIWSSIQSWPSRAGSIRCPTRSSRITTDPDPLPETGGPHLVYLDVWEREVTYVEDPNLVENAVGVDTTSRLQTAWQVRVLPNVGDGATCATPDEELNGWLDIIRPSAGRLTTKAVGVATPTDPVPHSTERRLSRTREPDLSSRDSRRRRDWRCDLQMVTRQCFCRERSKRDRERHHSHRRSRGLGFGAAFQSWRLGRDYG